jgi:hypothetical protein
VTPRPLPHRTALCAAALIGAAAQAHAQVSVSADATAASVHYEGYLRSNVVLFTPVIRYEHSLLTLAGRGNFSVFESGNRSVDILGTASLFTPSLGPLRGELAASGGIAGYRGVNTGYGILNARGHLVARRAGTWLGGGRTSVTSATTVVDGYFAEGGAWARALTLGLAAHVRHVDVDQIEYMDMELGARWGRGWLDLSGSAGGRSGDPTGGARAWGEISATIWLTQQLAIVAGHGSYPNDPAQLTPGGRYSSLSFRVATRPPALRDALARTLRYDTPPIAVPVVAGFEARRVDGSMVRIRVRAPQASSVELMGDFTDWSPVRLTRRRGNSWEVTLPIERGTHQLNVRVDGGEWGIPPGIGASRDEFGGVVGLLVVI